jgi:hypothetical protein
LYKNHLSNLELNFNPNIIYKDRISHLKRKTLNKLVNIYIFFFKVFLIREYYNNSKKKEKLIYQSKYNKIIDI